MKTMLSFIILMIVTANVWANATYSQLIPYPFYKKDTSGNNEVMSVFDGYAAFQIRLEMIRRAQKNIEVEYFIYNTDLAGKILTRELVKAAERGVKVRILVDKSIPTFKLNDYYAFALKQKNVEVKYYNIASLLMISTVQFRNHRKLISVDDKEAITGGRNIGDEYFDLSHDLNFNDTDIYIKGPVVKTMRESFDSFYDHRISQLPKFQNITDAKLNAEAAEFLEESAEEVRILQRLSTIGKKHLADIKQFSCPELTYVTDGPGATFVKRLDPAFVDKYKFVRKTLYDKLSEVDKSVIISSPYLLMSKHANSMIKSLLKRKISVTVYTNSLASTDAIYVASNFYFDIFKWVSRGIKVHLHDGKFSYYDNKDLEEDVMKAKWGTHSKVQIYEGTYFTEAMIGTYNIDNRSNFYNAELAVFCRGNDEFTAVVKNEVQHSINKAVHLQTDGTATDRDGNKKDIFGSTRKDLFLMNLIFIPSWMLKFLL